MEYTSNATVKQAIERAHEARAEAMKSFLSRLFRSTSTASSATGVRTGVSRWA